MARSLNEGLAQSPTFTPHRVAVTVADAAPPTATIDKKHGVDSRGFKEAVASVDLDGGAAISMTVEILLWSDHDGNFLKQEPAVTFSISASRMLKFTTNGQRFFVHLSGTFGGTSAFVDVAGAPAAPEERA